MAVQVANWQCNIWNVKKIFMVLLNGLENEINVAIKMHITFYVNQNRIKKINKVEHQLSI